MLYRATHLLFLCLFLPHRSLFFFFFFNDTATTEIYTLSLHDALPILLPSPPNQNDRIVFLTDTSTYQQCSTCAPHDAFALDELQKNVVRLYGPSGSAQILTSHLSSYSLDEIK